MSELYEVEYIIDKKIEFGLVKYLIKWKDWPVEESTWEPVENLKGVRGLIIEFEKEFKKRGLKSQTHKCEAEYNLLKKVGYLSRQKKRNLL
jgi:hypothetical protein